MKFTRRGILNLAIILSVVLIQLSSAARAMADDGTPPEETPVVSPTEDPAGLPDATETPEASQTEELTPTETAADPTDEAAPEETATPDPTDEATPEETATPDPTEEVTPEETATPDPTEEATPEETATPDPEQAADEPACIPAGEAAPGDETLPPCPGTLEDDLTVPVSDPMWCPAGVTPATPGQPGCTPSFATITELIDYLEADPTAYSGDGAIYFQSGAYTGPETYVVIDYTVVPALGTLDLLGGWDLDPADGDGYEPPAAGEVTTFTVPVEVIWDEDLALVDIVVALPPGSPDAGLFVSGGGDVTLENVSVSGGYSGAEVTAGGDVDVTGGVFSDNANTGLLIYSSGSVTLTDVVADRNNNGIFIDNTGADPADVVTLDNIFAADNRWTGIDVRSAGDIHMDGGGAGGGVVGANLETTAGAGNIFVDGSTFAGNTSVGLRAITNTGDIALTGVQTDSGDVPGSFGAWLKSYGGGSIAVTGGVFANADTGLFVVGTGDVTLTGVTAEGNLGEGAMIESGWVFGCFGPDGIDVTIDGGTYQDNGGYGIVIYPGPNGTGTLAGTIAFLNNTDGDVNLDLTKSCNPGGDDKPSKPYQVVELSGEGDDPVLPDCENYSGVILILPDLTQIKLSCPVTSEVTVAEVVEADLPGPLPKSVTLIAGLVITTGEDASPVRMCFKLPAGSEGKHFAILFWDPIANGSLGGWIELPVNQFGGQVFPLHPDTPEDGMLILEGVYRSGDCVCVQVNFGGTFVLVAR
ncbi:MAG: right-handed parallel beta-helix repeat-containing protein [Anaerolineales bacterium]|nr:right-handed parallel beta-helix repeat-containing protein [Anaerolineales bacterium]